MLFDEAYNLFAGTFLILDILFIDPSQFLSIRTVMYQLIYSLCKRCPGIDNCNTTQLHQVPASLNPSY